MKYRIQVTPEVMAAMEEMARGRGVKVFDATPIGTRKTPRVIPLSCDRCGKTMKYVGDRTFECPKCEGVIKLTK